MKFWHNRTSYCAFVMYFASSDRYTIAMLLYTYYTIYQFLTSYLWSLFVIRDIHDHKVICRMKRKRCS